MSQGVADFLQTLPAFRGIGDTEMLGIARCCDELQYGSHDVVFEMGAHADGAYIVRQGLIRVELPLPDGNSRVVAQLGPGTMVGELCLIEDAPRSLRVRAAKPSEMLRLDLVRFADLRVRGHSGAYKLIRAITLTVCDRLRSTNMQIENRWKGVTETSTEIQVAAKSQPEAQASAWDRLRGLFGRS